MRRSGSFSLVNRAFEQDNKKYPKLRGSVGSDLHGLEQDRAIKTEPGEARRRRTIKLHRNRGQSWGFTLQTYGIRNKRTKEVEIMSYVDYVEVDGSAWMAGMRRGDIILSINGESVELCTHRELVRRIQKCTWELRLVVLFEDCCQKVELHERFLKLKRSLSQKLKELRELEAEEKKIRHGIPLSRCDSFRQSTYSSTSSDWDIYSEITSPTLYDSVPVNRFAFRENCNQSFSDISTESSINSDSLSSVSSFIPKGEEDSLSLKSSNIAEDDGKASGGKIGIARDNKFLSSALSEDSCFSSEVLEKKDSIIIQSHLAKGEDGSRFLENDDRLASFIQDRQSRFLSDELEDSVLKNDIYLADEDDEEEDAPISFQCSFQEESNGFSHVEIEGRQRCIKCELEQMDSYEKQNEVGCRHTFPESVDSVFQSGDVLPEVSKSLISCRTPSSLPTTDSPSIASLCRYEENAAVASDLELQAGDILSQVLVALPCENGSAETGTAFNHRHCTTPRQSEVEEYAQFGQDSDSITGLTCDVSASALNHQETTTLRQSEVEEYALLGQDSDSITRLTCDVSASALNHQETTTPRQSEVEVYALLGQDSDSIAGLTCDVSASALNHQETTTPRQSEVEEYAQFGQDSDSIAGLTCDVPATCLTEVSGCCSSTSKQGNMSSGFDFTGLGFSLYSPLCDACNHVAVNCSGSRTKCQDSCSKTAFQDISDSNPGCQHIIDVITGNHDYGNGNTKCQDSNNSEIKCQDISSSNTECQDISNIKCQDISSSSTKCQDINSSNIKCQDIDSSNIKCQDIIKIKCQDNCSIDIKCQDSPNSTRNTDGSIWDNCSQSQDSDSICLGPAVASGKSDTCSEHTSQTSQTIRDPPLASSVPALSGLFSRSAVAIARSLDHPTDQACVSSKKRLINGVLVNDRSYSTRL